jgi:hypothetical protein
MINNWRIIYNDDLYYKCIITYVLFKLLHVVELIVIYTNVGQLFIILIKLVLDTHLVL